MRRHTRWLVRILAALPLLSGIDLAGCQANALRDAADQFDREANRLDGNDVDLGDFLSDLVSDL